MQGRKAMVTAVRRPNGEMALNTKRLGGIYTSWVRKAPLLRGVVVLIETMVLGMQTLLYSANVSLEEEDAEISGWMVWLMVGAALVLAVALFFLAPLFLANWLSVYITSSLLFALIEGLIRAAIVLLYLWGIGLMPDIKRLFAYHGAEHKTVNALEGGVPLEVEHVKKYGTANARCGTSFLFTVVIIAIIVFTFVGMPSLWLLVLSRILLLPVIAAFAYEFIYFSGRHLDNPFVRALTVPGQWLQRLTTREPDDAQLEVAIAALKKAIELDQAEETPPEAAS